MNCESFETVHRFVRNIRVGRCVTWFDALTGFPEISPTQVRENIVVERESLTSRVNGKTHDMRSTRAAVAVGAAGMCAIP